MWRTRLAVTLMVAVAVAAFAANPIAFRDQGGPDVANEAQRRLKTQYSITLDGLHPRHIQVIEARMTGPTPDHVEGRVVFRTLFGIPAGESDLEDRSTSTRIHPGRWAGAWLGFIAIEAALGLYLIRQLDI